MRIEQYFLMTDYLLWEVILNGDSPAPTRVIEGVVWPVAPTTAKQRLARKNELKNRGTLLMALPDKHQLKFNIHNDAKTLVEAIEKRFGGNKETKNAAEAYQSIGNSWRISLSQEDINLKLLKSLPTEWRTHTLIWRIKTYLEEQNLDDLFNSLKIYEAEVKSSSSASTSTQNIAFVSSQTTDNTNKPVSVSAASVKIPVFALSNVDTLSNVVIYSFFASQSNSPQLDNNDLKQIDTDDLENMDLKWQMAMLTVECYNCHRKGYFARECSYDWSFWAEEEPTNYALMAFTSSSSSSSDNEVASCSKAYTKAHATLQSHYDKLTNDHRNSQFDVISYKTLLESIEARLLVYQQNEIVFEEDIKLLKLKVQLRDDALIVLRQKFEKAEQERDDLLGYNTQVFTSFMFDCDEMFSSETDESLPASPVYARYQSGEGYHAVPLPYTGTFMPPKHDLVFHDAPNVNEIVHTTFNVALSLTKPDKELSHRPSASIIEDWVSDSEADYEAELPQNAPSFVQPTEQVKTHRPSIKPVENSIPASNHKTTLPKPKSHGNSRNRKACFVCKSLTHLIKDCNYYEKKMAQTHARNHAQRGNHQQYARMTLPNPQRQVVPTSVLTKSKLVPLTAAREVTTAVSPYYETRPRPVKTVVSKPHSPPRKKINRRPSPKASTFPPKVTAAKAPMVNAVKGNWGNLKHALKDKGVIDSGCSRHMTGNMSYLSDFKEINGGYIAFGGNSNGGKISRKGKTGQLSDENQVLLRVPRENNLYNVDLKNIVSSGDLTFLFANATLDESTLWHRRLGHINFKTTNKLVKGNLVRGLPTKVFKNNHTCVACKKGKQHRASCKTKHVSSVSQPLQRVLVTKHQNKTPYELLLSRTPSIGFMRPFGCPVTILNTLDPLGKFNGKADEGFLVGYSNTDDDATFEVKEPEFKRKKPESEVHVSPSSSAQTKKHDDKIKREAKGKTLEDITYSDDEEAVGADVDFTNLETNITASPIPTTRVHNDHHVTQIIGTKWVFRNKKDERGIVVRNKARLVAQGHTQEEGIDYKEVFVPVTRIEAIRLFLAYASFMGFMVYQMDVKSAFLYETIEEEVYVCQPTGFEDPDYLDKVYVDYIIFGSPNKDLCKAFEKLMKDKFQMSSMDGKSTSTPIDTEKPLLKDPDGEDVDVHTYRSMIGSLMYLTSSRPDIMFAVCACARFQVTPKVLFLHTVKRIFRYLKGKPHLGLWYPKDSPFNLMAYSDSDYASASLDRKSTTWGC
nr:hypothetical protein [Tanacetum cinerariifolium]